MPQSLAHVLLHVVFSTKHRVQLIPTEMRDDLYAYMGGVLKTIECPPIMIGGMSDHVHVLCVHSKNIALKGLMEEIKTETSAWMKGRCGIRDFYWQRGYAAFSVSQSNAASVSEYIKNQEQHHRKFDFQEELRNLLKKHGVNFDERYVWD